MNDTQDSFCGLTYQPIAATSSQRRWPVGHKITWTVVAGIPGFSIPSLIDIYKLQWDKWDLVCGIEHEYRENPRAANILMGSRQIDGPAGVLAEAELPDAPSRAEDQKRMWMDSSDRWTNAPNWQNSGRMPVGNVSCHEIGHNIGLFHNQDGLVNALMDPTISHISEPQPPDIADAVDLYGKDTPPPLGPGPVDPPDKNLSDGIRKLIECLRRVDKYITEEDKEFLRSLIIK